MTVLGQDVRIGRHDGALQQIGRAQLPDLGKIRSQP